MNRSLTAIGVLLFLAAVLIVVVRSSKGDAEEGLREVGGRNPELVKLVDSESGSISGTTRRRVDRPTLAESLPEGTTVEDSKVMPGGIDVALANGLRISAAGASVTDKHLAPMAKLEKVTHVHLGKTSVTDAGVGALAGNVRAPLLSLHGIDPGDDYAGWLTSLVPTATVEVWPDHGHYPHLVDRDRFVERVHAFAANC